MIADFTPETMERAGLRAWPGIKTEWDGAWIRRAAGGYTQRANSVQSLDPADDGNAEARIAAGRSWFEARGLTPVFRQTPLAGPATVSALDAEDWTHVDASQVFAMDLPVFEAYPNGHIHDLLDPIFLAAQQRLRFYADEKLERLKALLKVIEVPACGIVVRDDQGVPVASALMAIADGIVITGNVVTDATQRRKGYGGAMMRTGLAWAHAHGSTIAALNVAADNAAGQALYRSLGYGPRYSYVYRTPRRV